MQPDNSELLAKMSSSTSTWIPVRNSTVLYLSPLALDSAKVWLVGVALFRTAPSTPQNAPAQKHELLILHRAESEDTLPGYWEIPGGHIEPTDRNVLHAVDRETLEETGLIAQEVVGEFDQMTWTSRNGKQSVQVNYVVEVTEAAEETVVKLNPDEHSEWMWVKADHIDGLQMTTEMRKCVRDAFQWADKHMEL